jgi:hypothetical protein
VVDISTVLKSEILFDAIIQFTCGPILAVGQARMNAVVIEDMKPITENSVRAFCRGRFPSGVIIGNISVRVSNGHAWASPPAPRMTGRRGAPLLVQNGKP